MHAAGEWFSTLKARWFARADRPAARVSANPPFRRKYLVEALEPRVLLSADLPVVPPPVPDPLPAVHPAEAVAASAGGEVHAQPIFDATDVANGFVADAATHVAPPAAPASDGAAAPTEIAFVDWRVVGQDALTVQRDGMLVVVLDSNQDGIAQISETLSHYKDIKAVHVLAHGDAGEMFLGNSVLDARAVADGKVAGWGDALTKDGDVLLYGCNVAEGSAGQTFVQQLAAATGADVGASTDATGNAAAGGNWNLEFTVGALEATPISLQNITGLLATFTGTSGADTFTTGTGNGDIYNFQSAFLTAADTVTDTGTGDELRITTAASLADTAFTNVSGVEKLVLGNFTNSVTLGTEAQQWAASVGGTLEVDAHAGTGTNTATVDASAFTSTDAVKYDSGSGNDSFTGGAGDDVFKVISWGGTDSFVGGAGNDTLDFSGISTALLFTFSAGSVTVTGTGGSFTASGIESIVGSNGANTFKIDAGGSFSGSIQGGGFTNTLDYSSYGTGVTVNLSDDSVNGMVTGITGTITNVTAVVGSASADTITDGGIGNSYQGSGGDDTYVFTDDWGTDTVTDSGGANILDFGTGSSGIHVSFNSATSVAVTEGGTAASPTNSLTLTLTGTATLATVHGTTDDDVFTAAQDLTVNTDIFAGGGDDLIQPLAGSDFHGTVDGEAGTVDTLDFSLRDGNLTFDVTTHKPDNFSGTVVHVEKIQHPATIANGFQSVAGFLEQAIEKTVGNVDLPLVGNIGGEANGFIDSVSTTVVDGITQVLTVNVGDTRSTSVIINDYLTHTLSVDFTNSIPGATTGTFGLVIADTTHMEFALVFNGVIYQGTWAVDFSSAIPGLGLSIDADVTVSLTYAVRLAFGVDYTDPHHPEFYFDTNGADNNDPSDDNEITLSLSATIENALDLTDPQLTATLGFLQFQMTSYDNSAQKMQDSPSTLSPYHDSRASGLFGSFAIDLKDPGADIQNVTWAHDDGRLTKAEFNDSHFKLKDNISAKFNAEADVDLFAVLSADSIDGGLPKIQFYLHYNQTFVDAEITFAGQSDDPTFGGPPTIVIEDLSLDLGTFISGFLHPLFEKIQTYTEPLQPIIDLLNQDIPILSDVGFLKDLLNADGHDGVSMLDFAGTILGHTKYAPVFHAFEALTSLITLVNSIPDDDASNILINLGTYTFGGSGNNLRDPSSKMAVPDTSGYDSSSKVNSSSATPNTKSFLESLKRDPVGGGWSIPILTEPTQILNLLTGRTADLVRYDMPELDFNFDFRKSVPLVFPLSMVLDAGFDVTIRMGFGFDSSGILEFLSTHRVTDIFDGFFIDDHVVNGVDQDEVEIHSHFSVGASVGISGIIEAGVEGGITGDIGFDLNDVVNAGVTDGKIHFYEIPTLIQQGGPLGFLNIHGSLDWFLDAFVWVGLDLGFFGKITLYDETFDLGGGNIVTFQNAPVVVVHPDVAHIDGSGNLILHMGSYADWRDGEPGAGAGNHYSDTNGDNPENFDVALDEDGIHYNVSYAGETEQFLKSDVTGQIIADGQGGNDILTVGEGVTAGLTFDGGDGNDNIVYLGTGTATIRGGIGDDRITIANGPGFLYGGSGKDTITGGDLADYIDGGDGNDKIKGGDGNDEIHGGDESVAIDPTTHKANGDTIDGGKGNDTIYGGTGSDIIKGGDGNDTIFGGDENVVLVRNSDGTVNIGASTGVLPTGKTLGDSIDAGAGDDTVYGGAGDDTIKGGTGADLIYGGSGDDAITGGAGIDQIYGDGLNFVGDTTTRTGADSINWTVGDASDSVVNGGGGADNLTITGADADTAITLTGSSANVLLNWGADSFTLVGLEKLNLNAGTGADVFTINDLAATTVKELSVSLGGTVTNVTQYDYNQDGTYGDNPPALLDAGGQVMHDGSGNTLFADVYSDTTSRHNAGDQVPYRVVTQSVTDSSADQVILNGSGIADRFTLSNATVPSGSFPTYTIQRQDYTNINSPATLLTMSLTQGNFAADTLTVNSLDGNDVIDASGVTTGVAALKLNSGNNDDRVLGSQLADRIDSGAGNDNVTGNAGLDTFIDASGIDSLNETRNTNFDLSSSTLKIGLTGTTEVEDVSVFEKFGLTGGAGANTLTVHDFNKTVILDGAGGGDAYDIWFTGTGASSITEQDSGGTAGLADSMVIHGTAGIDNIESNAVTTISGTLSEVNGSNREVVRYNATESLDVRAGAGNDVFTINDTAMEINFYGEADNDQFTIGSVTSTQTFTNVWLLADNTMVTTDPHDPTAVFYSQIDVASGITNGISYSARFYGGDGDDYFEVNHNLAELWLNGENDNDRFVINAHLTNDSKSNVVGGGGSNRIEYVQNAKVFIDGGAGVDTVVINGTSIADTFIVTVVVEDLTDINGNFILDGSGHHVQGPVQKVVGAGLQIGKIANVESLEINGSGGNDKIYVFATLPGMDLTITGGSGDDTIYLGGAGVSVTGVTPAHFDQPPTVPAHDDPPYIDHYVTYTVDPDPYWYWSWDYPFFNYYDPPPFTYSEAVWVDPPPVAAYTPPKVLVPATPYTFTQADRYELTGITGTFTINGDSDNDTIVVANRDGTSANSTGALSESLITSGTTTTSYTSLSGFGIAAGEKINITNTENLNLNLGAFDDLLTVTHTDPILTTSVNLGNGTNTVNITDSAGDFNVVGGTGSDTLNLGSLAPNVANTGSGTLANITGVITFAAGGGTDALNLDNDGNADSSSTITLTSSSISGPGLFGGVSSYSGVETLLLNLGSGADTVNVLSTSATTTTINANGGADVFNVSSDGAALTGNLDSVVGTLNLHAGAGNNTLNVSDFGASAADTGIVVTSAAITGLAPGTINYDDVAGRFTGGVNIWAGTGNDVATISSTTLADVTTFYANAGNDNVTVSNLTGGSNRFLSIHGDAGNDSIDASAILATDFTVLLYGDSGQDTYSSTDKQFLVLTSAVSTAPTVGGTDTLKGGAGRAILIGGTGGDALTSKDSDDVLIGDNGSVQLAASVVTQINSTDTNGGGDTITAAGGRNLIIGGVGGDTITALTGTNDVVFGDNGTATFTAAGVILTADSADLGSGGNDSINVGAGNNVVVGGAGGDTITTLGGTDVVIGDNGSATWTGGILTQFKSTDTTAGTGGDDTINVGDGRNYVIGGVGVDNTTAGTGDDVVLGDNGIVNFTTAGIITDATVTEIGLGGGEILNAGAGNNVVLGGAGGDTITTLGGTDVVIGDSGSVTWTGGIVTQMRSSDTTAGTGGDDTINVGDGRNYVIGGVGVDNTTAGTGDDVVLGDNGEVNFTSAGVITDATVTEIGLGGGEILNVGAGNNVVLGGAGGDTITALGGTDVVIGDSGSATWTGGIVTQMRSSDTTAGTGGDDTINVGDGRNYVIGGVGVDNTTAGTGDDVVLGDNGIVNFAAITGIITDATVTEIGLGGGEILNVGAGNNVVLGGAGGDTISALGGTDVVIGDNGSATWVLGVLTQFKSTDSVAGTGGNDTITVGDGNNYVIGGVGADGITAGTGNDVVLGDGGVVNFTTAGVITDATVTAEGTGGVDTIDVSSGDNVVLAGDGGDSVTALDGQDVVIGDNGQATWVGGVLTQFKSNNTGAGGDDIINVGTAAGVAGKNYVIGGVGLDAITGGQNDDVVLGDNGVVNFTTAGVITDAAVTEIGTGDVDTIDVRGGNNVVLAGAGGDTVTALGGMDVVIGDNGLAQWTAGVLTKFKSTDSVAGTGGNDTITVGEGNNYVIGGVGVDGITAGAGNDVVLGDSGEVNFTPLGVITDATVTAEGTGGIDTIDVGSGDNVVLAGDGGDSVTALDGQDVVIGDNGQATWVGGVLTQFKSNNTGAGGDDTINVGTAATGVVGKNYVIGGVGLDAITGGQNDDVVLGDNGIVNFTVLGVITDATVTEIGTGGVDTIDVRGGNNVVLGGAGGDTITALGGTDVVIGDNGSATWTGGILTQFKSTDTTAGTGGNDTVDVGNGNNYVIGGVGADGIAAGTGNDVVLGDNGIVNFTAAGVITDATATELGLGGVDTINAGAGNNVVVGGAAGDSVTTGAGNDIVIGDNGNLIFTAGILTDAATTDTTAATGGNDSIAAGDGANVVLGGVGDDTIITGSGKDVIIGDNGVAQFNGAGALLRVDARDPLLAGDDSIDAGAGDDVVIGGSGADSILGGAGNDVLIGDAGTATFTAGSLTQVVGDSAFGAADFINGGTGIDILLGGFGDDTLVANLTEDLFTGGNARISFSGGLVTTIELIDGVDLVLQALFDSFSAPKNEETVIQENNPDAGGGPGGGGGAPSLSSFGSEGVFASDGTAVLPGLNSLTFNFGRGAPLSQVPELLRNIVLEMSLGNGNPPATHGGDAGGQGSGEGQGGGNPPAGGDAQSGETLTLGPMQAPFAVEAESTTLPAVLIAEKTEPQDPALALAAGAAAITGLAPGQRAVQAFDPLSGRLAARSAAVTPAQGILLDRAAFAPRGIDW